MPIQKENACKGTALKNIKYITNFEKTTDENGKRWVETHNMISEGSESPTTLHKEFREINNLWNKNKDYDERKYYHTVINFKGVANVTPEMVMNVGRAYLEHFYPNNQAVMAVHCDRDGFHLHACINSVNMETGKKIDRTDKDLAERKDYVNEVAQKMYGIEPFDWRAAIKEKRSEEKSETRSGKKNNFNYAEQQMHADGRASELDELRGKILRTALSSYSRQEFEERLQQEYGITMPRNTEKTVSFKYKEGDKGTIRGRTLGDYYTAAYIDKIIAYNRKNEFLKQQGQNDSPSMDFDDVTQIAKKKDYTLAKKYGFGMSEENFYKMSDIELSVRVAFAFVRKNQHEGLKVKNGHVYINGQKVETDERLQKMIDSGNAAKQCREKYGCKDIKDFDKKSAELEDELQNLKTKLRKERKIETALKNKLQRCENLYRAIKMVYQNTGTPEEINKAKHLLYRNGIKQSQFNSVSTVDEISRKVIKSRNALSEQTEKTKALYLKQKTMLKDIKRFDTARTGFSLSYDPKFYYGDEIDQVLAIEGVEDLITNAVARVGEPKQTAKQKIDIGE